MKHARRDRQRRVTPALIDFYIARGHALRAEAWREVAWGMYELLKRLLCFTRPLRGRVDAHRKMRGGAG